MTVVVVVVVLVVVVASVPVEGVPVPTALTGDELGLLDTAGVFKLDCVVEVSSLTL